MMTLLWVVMIASMIYGAIKLFGWFKKSPKRVNIVAWWFILFSLLATFGLATKINNAKTIWAKQYRVTQEIKSCTLSKTISTKQRVNCMIDWATDYSDLEDELYNTLY